MSKLQEEFERGYKQAIEELEDMNNSLLDTISNAVSYIRTTTVIPDGKWKRCVGKKYKCSVCGNYEVSDRYAFCRHCGANMKGD